jgi:two-component system, OmpR family, phosphate regulon response regulator PhoB
MMMADGSQVSLKDVHVGVVEDSQELSVLLDDSLSAAGYSVQLMRRGEEALLCLSSRVPDLMIIDWSLPSLSGVELLHRLRQKTTNTAMPIIMLTSFTGEHDIVQAFDAGADDLVSKPFSVQELLARIEALLRRRIPDKSAAVLKVGDIEFDRDAMRVRRRGRIVELGPINMQLIELFLAHPGEVLSRQEILEAVWGHEGVVDARTIDVHVGRLRKALLTAWRTDPITTLRGVGYRYDPK